MTQATPTGAGEQAPQTGGDDAAFDSSLAEQLSGLLDREDDTSGSDDGDAAIDTGADESGDDAPQSRQADDATDEQGQDDEQRAETEPEHAVKIDGQERRVKLSELIASYQKGEASGKRFEEAAAARREVEQHRTQVTAERQALSQALQHYTQQLAAMQQQSQPNWEQLLAQDPVEFQRQRYYYEQRSQQLQQAQAAQAYLAQQQQAQVQQESQQRLLAEAQRMVEAIPEWRDAAKAAEGRKELRESLAKGGFTESEIDSIADHRMVMVARKAMLYDRLVADQKAAMSAASNKLQKLPPARVERPGTGGANAPDGRARAMQRLNRSGSVDDAAAYIATLL